MLKEGGREVRGRKGGRGETGEGWRKQSEGEKKGEGRRSSGKGRRKNRVGEEEKRQWGDKGGMNMIPQVSKVPYP